VPCATVCLNGLSGSRTLPRASVSLPSSPARRRTRGIQYTADSGAAVARRPVHRLDIDQRFALRPPLACPLLVVPLAFGGFCSELPRGSQEHLPFFRVLRHGTGRLVWTWACTAGCARGREEKFGCPGLVGHRRIIGEHG
jgi:hypothetical protein